MKRQNFGRNMKKRIFTMAFVFPLLLLMFPGCSFGQEYLKSTTGEEIVGAPPPSPMMVEPAAESMKMMRGGPAEMESAASGAADVSYIDRKVIYTGNARIEVKSCDKSIEKIKEMVAGVKGVVADISVTTYDEGYKTANVVIQVPSDNFEQILNMLGDLGKVKSRSSSGEDITEEYVDLTARLENAKRMEKRLVDLLENQSKNLKDMLDVEKELGRVRENIERFEGKKRYFDTRVAMSTITIELFEPYKYSTSIIDPVKNALDKAGELFMKSVGGVLLFAAAAVPWFILIAVLAYIVGILIRRWIRKLRKKEIEKEEIKIEKKEEDPKETENW